jgi:hypothetical protein
MPCIEILSTSPTNTVKCCRSKAEFDDKYNGTILSVCDMEIFISQKAINVDDSADTERTKRKRETVNWTERLSRDGQIEDASMSPVMSGKSSRRSKATDVNEDAASEMGDTTVGKKGSRKKGRLSKGDAAIATTPGDNGRDEASSVNAIALANAAASGSGSGRKGKRSLDDKESKASQRPTKRGRGSGAGATTGDDAEDDAPEDWEFEPIDIKEDMQVFINVKNGAFTDLPGPLVGLVDFWVRWMWLLYSRLQEAELWKRKSDAILIRSYLDRKGGGGIGKKFRVPEDVMRVKNWRNAVLRSNEEEILLNLMQWATRRNIMSTRRYECVVCTV